MKIAIICNKLPPEIDGVGDYTWKLSKQLVNETTYIYIYYKPSIKPENLCEEEGIYPMPIQSKWSINAYIFLFKKLKEINPSFLILQYVPYSFHKWGVPWALPIFVLAVKLFSRTKQIIFFHELANGEGLYKLKYALPAMIQFLIAYMLSLLAEVVLVSTDVVKEQIRWLNKNIYLIPIGSNFIIKENKKYTQNGSKEIFRISTLGLGANRNIELVSIIENVLSTHHANKIIFYILGKVGQREKENLLSELEAKGLSHFVNFTGILTEMEMITELQQSDIFFLKEKVAKGFGGISTKSGALASAWALGLPVLSTFGHLTDETYFINEHNILLSTDEVDSFSLKLIELINNATLRRKIGENGHETFLQNMSWEQIGQKYTSIFNTHL